jgi:antitoxin (DNA-binding transcriptional repressor) of toxin-antitoxin stability system
MAYNMVMLKVNVFEVKAKLSEYLDRATRGERIVICRHNRPVAELRAIEAVRTEPRPIGPLPGRPTFEVPASFFDPLPQEELDLWEGVAANDPLSPTWTSQSAPRIPQVAESKGGGRAVRGRRVVRRRS